MAKIKPTTSMGKEKAGQTGAAPQKGDRILFLINTGMQDVNELAKAFSTISSSLNSRKVTETDNAVKMSRAETDAQKEANRHSEQMAKIEQEWKKISDAAADRDRRLSFIQGQIEKFQAEYDRYLSLEKKEFLTDTVTSRIESLRKVIVELTKELNRA